MKSPTAQSNNHCIDESINHKSINQSPHRQSMSGSRNLPAMTALSSFLAPKALHSFTHSPTHTPVGAAAVRDATEESAATPPSTSLFWLKQTARLAELKTKSEKLSSCFVYFQPNQPRHKSVY